MTRILLIEDDESLQTSLLDYLSREGYQIDLATNVKEALEKFSAPIDLVILDWMLPDGQGLDLLAHFRKQSLQVPIIFLTARTELIDKVLALEMGASDYLTKPFEPRELLARIRTQIRIHALMDQSVKKQVVDVQRNLIEVGQLRIDQLRHEVVFGGKKADLVKKEYDLLTLLAESPERVFSRDEILNKVWGYDVFPTTRTVDTHVMLIRQKTSENLIETVRSIGYRLKVI
jgi:DNA-binding response OmpR family regulator